MNNLIPAIMNRDGETLARIMGEEKPSAGKVLNENIEKLVDSLFRSLKQVYPASVSTAWKNEADEKAAKRQWIAAFAENGVSNMEQLKVGMRQARASGSPFLPSPGQFIEWCKSGERFAAGLPDEQGLYDMFRMYCRDRGMYDCSENFPWESPASFHMVTAVYNQMRSFNLSDAECRVKLREQLSRMSRRIEAGEEIPPPRKQIPLLHIPVGNERGLDRIAEIRKKHGMKRG